MCDVEDLKTLIKKNTRRLQLLKEKKATLGLNAHPSLQIEIEDTEEEIQRLLTQLSELNSNDSDDSPDTFRVSQSIALSSELKEILDELYEHCEAQDSLVTSAHLFHRLLSNRLARFQPPLLTRIEGMLEGFAKALESNNLKKKGYQITDSVSNAVTLSQHTAKKVGATEVEVEQLLLTLLDHPGTSLGQGLKIYGIEPQEIISVLKFTSPNIWGS